MRYKPRVHRFDHDGKTVEAGDLSALAYGQRNGDDVFLLDGGEAGFFLQYFNPSAGVKMKSINRQQARHEYVELDEKYKAYDDAFGEKIIAPDHLPGGSG